MKNVKAIRGAALRPFKKSHSPSPTSPLARAKQGQPEDGLSPGPRHFTVARVRGLGGGGGQNLSPPPSTRTPSAAGRVRSNTTAGSGLRKASPIGPRFHNFYTLFRVGDAMQSIF